ncbi:MFS transporter [Nocardia carnea]|uniref:MFS transporter n=1 Tax=Nocardia carnea TaxID=37328 RepID=UPI0024569D28|nr:MFS transporter [Nocardia carnea]
MTYPERLALAVLSAATLMTILDGSIVTVALPAIEHELGFTPAGSSWIVNAYLIAFGGLLLLGGRLGDLVGRRTIFLAGNGIFAAASLFAGAATTPGQLIAARFLQGVGSAFASAVALGILITLFTGRRERTVAIGVFGFTGAAGAALGQVLGGVLTDGLGWQWIFLINVPIGLVTILAAVRVLPADRGAGRIAKADVLGAALATAGPMLGIYAIVEVERYGWTAARTLGLGAVSLTLLVAFVARQATAREPLMPLRIFLSRNVTGANLTQMLALSAMFAFQVLVALYMQRVLGYGALETGSAMLPAAVAIGGVSLFVSPRLNARFGERNVLIVGLLIVTAGMLWLTRLPVQAAYLTDLLPVMVLVAGFGLIMPALTALGMSDAAAGDAGLASGLFNTTQQIGMALGVAVLSTLASARTGTLLDAGAGAAEALTSGYRSAFAVAAGLLVSALVVAATVLRPAASGGLPEPGLAEVGRPAH